MEKGRNVRLKAEGRAKGTGRRVKRYLALLEQGAAISDQDRAEELLQAHRRVRTAARIKGLRYRVEPDLPPDILGIYVYLPVL